MGDEGTKGILFQTEQDLGQICRHKFELTAGLTEALVLGGDSEVILGGRLRSIAGININLNAAGSLEAGIDKKKIWGKADAVAALRNDLDAVSNRVLGKNAKVVGDETRAAAASQRVDGERQQAVAAQTTTAASLVGTMAENIETIATSIRILSSAVLSVAEQTNTLGSVTNLASTQSTIVAALTELTDIRTMV